MPPEREDGSSPSDDAAAQAATAATQAETDAKAAGSSAAEDANEPSTLDAVMAALDEKGSGDSSSPEGGQASDPDAAKTDADGDKAKGDGTDEAKEKEDEPPPFHEHPAWQKQLAKTRTAQAEAEALKPKAEHYDRMMGFIQEQNLDVPEVNAGFEIMALMKNDPAAALEKLRPYFTALQSMVGEVLPNDLAEKVQTGELTEDAAKELATLRSGKAQSEAERARAAEREAQGAATRALTDIGAAVTGWENAWAAEDPDYPKLKTFVRDRAAALLADAQRAGKPVKSGDEAVALLKEAKAQIVKEFGSAVPKPKGIAAPVESNASVKATAEPQSTLDAINLGISRAAAA
jgi:hypothetical protein